MHRVPWLVLAIVSLAMSYKLFCRYCDASAQAARKSAAAELVTKQENRLKAQAASKNPFPAVVGPESKGDRWAWRRSRLNDTGPLLMVAVGLVQLLFLVLNATDSGKQWFKEAVQNRVTYKLRMAELDDFTADLCARLRLPHLPRLSQHSWCPATKTDLELVLVRLAGMWRGYLRCTLVYRSGLPHRDGPPQTQMSGGGLFG